MRLTIDIDTCDENTESLFQHLTVIQKQLKKAFKTYSKKDEEIPAGKRIAIEDNNCYGYHKAVFLNRD